MVETPQPVTVGTPVLQPVVTVAPAQAVAVPVVVSPPAAIPPTSPPVYVPQGYPNSNNDSNKKLWFMVGGAALLVIILLIGGYFLVKTMSSSETNSTNSTGGTIIIPTTQGEGEEIIPVTNNNTTPNRPPFNTSNNSNSSTNPIDNSTSDPVVNNTIPSLEDLLNEANGTGEGTPDEGIPSSTSSGRLTSVPPTGFIANDGTNIVIRSLTCSSSALELSVETLAGSPSQILFLAGDGNNLQDYAKTKTATPIETFSLDVSAIPLALPDTIVELGYVDSSGNYTTLDLWDCQR